jgi:hypothetical protein
LFNVAAAYGQKYPNDDPLVFTGGSSATADLLLMQMASQSTSRIVTVQTSISGTWATKAPR